MNSVHSSLDKQKIEFLKNEYEFLSDYIKYKYDERDKYIKFFIGVLTALAAVIGISIRKEIWETGLIFSLLAFIFSFFILMKTLNQRIVVTEYKNDLNMVRRKFWELSGSDEKIKLAILPIEESLKCFKISSGDIHMLRIIEAITAFSYGGSVFFAYKFNSAQVEYEFPEFWIKVILVVIIVFSVCVLEITWRKLLKDEDKKFTCKNCKHLHENNISCEAYPDGIPEDILKGEKRHLYPRDDQQNDIVFLKRVEAEDPKALAPRS